MARILVIDDDKLVRSTIKQMLRNVGHTVSVAMDGNDGLRQFQEASADLVLCDVFMPNKDGIATLRELRRISSELPVIVMSGGAPSSSRVGEEGFVDNLRMAMLLGATSAPSTCVQLWQDA